jgi:hypothetical protein
MSRWGAQYDEWSPRRRKQMATRAFFGFAFFLAVGAFAAGYFWKANSSRLLRSAPPPDTALAAPERKQALEFIDEAIRAKHEKRTSGALAALDRARKTDPSAPGINVTFAELALGEKQFIEMRAAAEAAKKKNDYAAAASVLLGMDKWINRGASDREMTSAADAAGVHFAEAMDVDYFAAPAWFFSADVMRYAGRVAEGRDRAASALRRFQPWDSSDFLAAKLIFASAEARETLIGGVDFLPDSPFVSAASGFATAQIAGASTDPKGLADTASQLTLRALGSDPLYRKSDRASAVLPLVPR